MPDLTIHIQFAEIDEVIVKNKTRDLVIRLKNGDRFTLLSNDKTKRLHKRLIKQFAGDHLF